MTSFRLIVILALSLAAGFGFAASNTDPGVQDQTVNIPPYVSTSGRSRPVVAVVAENTFTELTDYVVPYGVLKESGVADVFALATQSGPIQMFPALRIRPQSTITEFDVRFPDGADYVIVPAVHHTEDPTLLKWLAAQAAKGATIVGVCDGVWVLAHAGLLKGHKAVGHWYSFDDLAKTFPETTWVRDLRYLADGKIITTTGVTASIPVSLALVEAIGGRARAASVAQAMGVEDWSAAHRSDKFKLRAPHMYTAATNWIAFWSHEEIGIPVSAGINEVTLALRADAYARTYRSEVVAISPSSDEVRTRGGLFILPDNPQAPDRILETLEDINSIAALNMALRDIAERYGQATADFVALQLEYGQP